MNFEFNLLNFFRYFVIFRVELMWFELNFLNIAFQSIINYFYKFITYMIFLRKKIELIWFKTLSLLLLLLENIVDNLPVNTPSILLKDPDILLQSFNFLLLNLNCFLGMHQLSFNFVKVFCQIFEKTVVFHHLFRKYSLFIIWLRFEEMIARFMELLFTKNTNILLEKQENSCQHHIIFEETARISPWRRIISRNRRSPKRLTIRPILLINNLLVIFSTQGIPLLAQKIRTLTNLGFGCPCYLTRISFVENKLAVLVLWFYIYALFGNWEVVETWVGWIERFM